MRIAHFLSVGLAAACLIPTASVSQEIIPCAVNADILIANLEKDWGEIVIADALKSNGHYVRWLVNTETGTWSMVVTLPSKAGCLTAKGTHFDLIALPGERS